jgi:homocitrate synthase NifV
MKEKCYIVDTSLRDGEQSPGLALGSRDKVAIAKLLDGLGVYEIEGGIPAMGKIEQAALWGMKSVCHRARIKAWNRLSLQDLRMSMECSPDVLHISVPVSDLQIQKKLQKNRRWLEKTMRECVDFARGQDYEVTIGFEDASRAELGFMAELAMILKNMGVSYIRFADTVGILTPVGAYEKINVLREAAGMEIEFHAHNDLGMAVANSVAALQAGARYIDVTLGGIGERTGNCALGDFVETAALLFDTGIDLSAARAAEAAVQNIFFPEKAHNATVL